MVQICPSLISPNKKRPVETGRFCLEVPARFELANESFADSCLTTWPRYHIGAGDEARTRYLHLGKVALYRMSYTRIWCLRSESNQRHADFQSAALPTELQRRVEENMFSSQRKMRYMATPNGLEPSTSSVTGWRANRLHHRAKFWWEQQGSNL